MTRRTHIKAIFEWSCVAALAGVSLLAGEPKPDTPRPALIDPAAGPEALPPSEGVAQFVPVKLKLESIWPPETQAELMASPDAFESGNIPIMPAAKPLNLPPIENLARSPAPMEQYVPRVLPEAILLGLEARRNDAGDPSPPPPEITEAGPLDLPRVVIPALAPVSEIAKVEAPQAEKPQPAVPQPEVPWIPVPLSSDALAGLMAHSRSIDAPAAQPPLLNFVERPALPEMRIPLLPNLPATPDAAVTLPAVRPLPDPGNAVPGPAAPLFEKIELILKVEKPSLAIGEPATLELAGPERFLNDAIAEYSINDELGRQIAHEGVALDKIKAENGADTATTHRKIKITLPADLALVPIQAKATAPLRLHIDMTVHGREKRTIKLGAEVSVARAMPADAATWDGWISLAANPPSANAWDKLNRLGITGGMQFRLSATRRELLKAGNAPFFVESVSRNALSRYHTERGLWQKTIETIRANRSSPAALSREPSLCSNSFAESYAADISRVAQVFVTDRPLFFSLASEPSMTRLNLPADFDFSPAALDEFRRWLERDVYGTIAALNEEWGTKFENWRAVQPMTTDEARMRLRDGMGNFAPWIDFRDFQDYTFAKVLREGAEQMRVTIPDAKVGVTGAMGPFAFGGWDWSRLANDLDVVECYDIGGARALWRDLAPGKPALASFTINAPPADGSARDAAEVERALWSFALEGGQRGALVWDSPQAEAGFVDGAGELTDAAKRFGPILKRLNGELGKILARGRREHDGVALLYSPASIRLHWLFEADRIPGDNWLERWGGDSTAERRESPQLRLRESWGKLLDDAGVGWRFASSREIEHGLLSQADGRIKTLILPRAIALSDREAEAIRQFAAAGGKVVADSACGRFDEHGKLRAHGALDELFGVNTSTEPAFSRPMKPLERVTALAGNEGRAKALDAELLNNLPPVFSDEPKWNMVKRQGAEYRLSPVLAMNKNTLFLNLDLTDYLRWRLQPDSKRAAAARRVVREFCLPDGFDDGLIDWKNSQIPAGTQVIKLSIGKSQRPSLVLALRRNPQVRLYELGAETDSNAAFEKAEEFKIVLREKKRLGGAYPSNPAADEDGKPASATELSGTIDPVVPSIFILHPGDDASELALELPGNAAKLSAVNLTIPPRDGGEALYAVKVCGPNGKERAHYGGMVASKDGSLKHAFVPALNDAEGPWSVSVIDLLSGASSFKKVEIKEAE